MEPAQRLTPRDRDRAIRRVRTLTAGAAVGGLVATGVFAAVAAISNPGKSADARITGTLSERSGETGEAQAFGDDSGLLPQSGLGASGGGLPVARSGGS